MKTVSTAVCLFFGFTAVGHAEDCADGLAAYIAGNYPKAAAIFQPLAEQGDDCAQYQLGEMYMVGQGVNQDRGKALALFKKSAAQGNGKAKVQAALIEMR